MQRTPSRSTLQMEINCELDKAHRYNDNLNGDLPIRRRPYQMNATRLPHRKVRRSDQHTPTYLREATQTRTQQRTRQSPPLQSHSNATRATPTATTATYSYKARSRPLHIYISGGRMRTTAGHRWNPRPQLPQNRETALTAFAPPLRFDSGIRLRRTSKSWLSRLERFLDFEEVVGSSPIVAREGGRPGSDRSSF